MNITTHCSQQPAHTEPIFSFFTEQLTIHKFPIFYTQLPVRVALVDLDTLNQALEQQQPDIPQLLLSPEEQTLFSRFSYPKRRREWLGGRLAAKTALLLFNDRKNIAEKQMADFSILPDSHGRPVLQDTVDRAVSITHSSRFAAALTAHGTNCGLDLQKISSRLPELANRFTTPAEIQRVKRIAPKLEKNTLLTTIWTAKEAIKKRLLFNKAAIFSATSIEQIQFLSKNEHIFFCRVEEFTPLQAVQIHILPPYVLALTGDFHA